MPAGHRRGRPRRFGGESLIAGPSTTRYAESTAELPRLRARVRHTRERSISPDCPRHLDARSLRLLLCRMRREFYADAAAAVDRLTGGLGQDVRVSEHPSPNRRFAVGGRRVGHDLGRSFSGGFADVRNDYARDGHGCHGQRRRIDRPRCIGRACPVFDAGTRADADAASHDLDHGCVQLRCRRHGHDPQHAE